MYIKDGSKIEYNGYGQEIPYLYSWGWLGNKVESSEKWASDKVKKDFLTIIQGASELKKVRNTRGFHVCEMCGTALGNAQIKIAYHGRLFDSPSGVAHYIEEHNYCPPQEVVEAVLHGHICSEDELQIDQNFDGKTSEDFKQEWDRVAKNIVIRHLYTENKPEITIAELKTVRD